MNAISEIQIIPELDGFKNVYQLYSVLLKSPEKRKDLQNFLLENGIYTRFFFYPIHLKTFYKQKFGYAEGDLPITENISKRILTLPFSLRFTKDDLSYIINKIKQFFN